MAALERKDLTPEQHQAVLNWWEENDPDQVSYEYADNDRYAIQGNRKQEAAYDERQRGGCCGFCDVELPLPDGTTLLYGFNYGH
jgi:hypothetical protein